MTLDGFSFPKNPLKVSRRILLEETEESSSYVRKNAQLVIFAVQQESYSVCSILIFFKSFQEPVIEE